MYYPLRREPTIIEHLHTVSRFRNMRRRVLASITCLLLCATSAAAQAARPEGAPVQKPRVLVGPLPGSSVSARAPLRLRPGAALQNAALTAGELDSIPALCAFGSLSGSRFTASPQYETAIGLGRAPPRAV
jgi:hypothetical protein